jgi:hypothetical protein
MKLVPIVPTSDIGRSIPFVGNDYRFLAIGEVKNGKCSIGKSIVFLFCPFWFLATICTAHGQTTTETVHNAWTDSTNPVRKRWDGERLDWWSLKPINLPSYDSLSTTYGDEKSTSKRLSNSIDFWIEKEVSSHGLIASAPASRETLIRRATWDLIGLPPTFDEIDAFVNDCDADAYERLIDRLLADSRYGIRWGQHWLDVVRYSDSNGFERDEFRPAMWRFRNYVIDAFNQDLPFDQFVLEQLAGDELNQLEPNHSRRVERLTATGYLRLGAWDKFKQFFDSQDAARDELMVDLTNTTGTAFLGQSLSCCRCHDHMTDPLLQSDHYRFRAYFAAVEFDDEVVIDEPPLAKSISEHNACIDAKTQRLESSRSELVRPAKLKMATAAARAEASSKLANDSVVIDTLTLDQAEKLIAELDVEDDDPTVLELLPESDRVKVLAIGKELEKLEDERPLHTTVWGVRENVENPPSTYVLDRGLFTEPREKVEPGIFAMFGESPAIAVSQSAATTARRLTLAKWIASAQNPWTARVLVNRVWFHHFGRGIFFNPDDIGISGGEPTHPELLDELAVDFMEHGWSVKRLHRQLMLSAAYARSSDVVPSNHAIDPENRWLSRQNLRSMGAEALRDGLLKVTKTLDESRCGPPRWPQVSPEDLNANPAILQKSNRLQGYYVSPPGMANVQSVFLVRKRTVPVAMLSAYGVPDSSVACGRRIQNINTPQALTLLNGQWVEDATLSYANQLLGSTSTVAHQPLDSHIRSMFRELLSREATAEEMDWGYQVARSIRDRHQLCTSESLDDSKSDSMRLAIAEIARALINSNEFYFVE